MRFSIKDFFSKSGLMKLRIWSNFRGGSWTATTYKTELFVIIVILCNNSYCNNYYHKVLNLGCCSSPRSAPAYLPRCWAYTWIGNHLFFLTAQNSIHSSWISRSKKWARAITTTSVSTVLIRARSIPFWAAWLRWTIILVSASSWLQGNRGDKWFFIFEVTSDSLVQVTDVDIFCVKLGTYQ